MVRRAFTCVSLSLLSVGMDAAVVPVVAAHQPSPGATVIAASAAEATAPISHLVSGRTTAKRQVVAGKHRTEVSHLIQEIRSLRGELVARHKAGGSWDEEFEAMEKQLEELEQMLEALQAKEVDHHEDMMQDHTALQAEIDHLREQLRRLEGKEAGARTPPSSEEEGAAEAAAEEEQEEVQTVEGSNAEDDHRGREKTSKRERHHRSEKKQGRHEEEDGGEEAGQEERGHGHRGLADSREERRGVGPYISSEGSGEHLESKAETAEPCDEVAGGGGIDVDMAMPYGDLEPFGREDTAQELTEASLRESNQMVDQLERAEVAEEKRAVFRALTRLRGAAITSYDGVARSQTGNIDDYARKYQWRKVHPVHHLASEEADVAKWAFPDSDGPAECAPAPC